MKRAIYKMLVFVVFVICAVISFSSDNYASEILSISENTIVRDTMTEIGDTRSYEYTVSSRGYITVGFSGENLPDVQWSLCLSDENRKELCAYTDVKDKFSTQKLNFAPGTKLYIAVKVNGTEFPDDALEYSLWITGVQTENWETETGRAETDEWKTRIAGAEVLSDIERTGSLWKADDNDVYKLVVRKTGVVTLNFRPKYTGDDIGWGYDVEIYSKGGKRATVYKQIKTGTKKKFWAKKGQYYVVIKASWSKAAPGATGEYAISSVCKANKVPGMKGTKISYSKKSGVIQWDEVKDADGYEVYIYQNKKSGKGYKRKYLTIENTYKLIRRFRKGDYKVRVRAYCETVTGTKIYGKYSKVLKTGKHKRKKG